MRRPLKILIAEDNPNDAELAIAELRRAGFEPDWARVDTEASFLEKLNGELDIVLSDFQMPEFNGLRALELLKQSGLEVPFILISGTIGEETAVKAMKQGATDYLLKDRLGRLGTSVTHALAENSIYRERLRAAEALRIADAQLGQLLEHSPAVLYMLRLVNAKPIPQLVSDNITNMLGFTVAEALRPEWWAEQLHPDDSERATESLAETLILGNSLTEYRVRHKDGHYCWVDDARRLIRDADGKPIEFIGVWTDITERKSAEEELRRSKAYLAEAQKLSLTGSFGWDVSADEHFWSEETFRIFEYDLSTKITLQLILERVHPQDLQLVRETIAEAAGRDFDYECRLLMPGGFVKHAHIVARAINSKSGLREFVGAVMDITATRGAEEALRRAQADLAHVSRITTLGELTASIAHEVNQPLGSVINNANACLSLLPSGTPQLDEVREALEEIIEGTDRASTVISRVRQLARKVPYERMLVNLGDVVADVLVLARYEAATRQVTIRTDLTEDLPSVWGDRVQLQQVLLNLVVNGMDAMNTVEVSKRILIISGRCEKRDGETACLLSVQDAGTGFKPEEKDRLFEAFYTTKSEGMGMGLAISRSIIEAHGGRLWAETNQGPGATFQFSLPDALNAKL